MTRPAGWAALAELVAGVLRRPTPAEQAAALAEEIRVARLIEALRPYLGSSRETRLLQERIPRQRWVDVWRLR